MNQQQRYDRITGVLLGCAVGDALGAPYEFHPPRGPELDVAMVGGGPWEVGEWTDDTSMAIPIAQAAATGIDLRSDAAQDFIVSEWRTWSRTAKDVGVQTSSVLRQSTSARSARRAAVAWYMEYPKACGNGALMRTSPVALAYLHDEEALVEAARMIAELTHCSPDASDACALWCAAIRHAVLEEVLDIRVGIKHIPVDRRRLWTDRILEAEQNIPKYFERNGSVVEAFQAAWSAITRSQGSFAIGVDAAVRAGYDTDTVAAIAGSLLGAAYGASQIPDEWLRVLHGWPGMNAQDLAQLAEHVTEIHA